MNYKRNIKIIALGTLIVVAFGPTAYEMRYAVEALWRDSTKYYFNHVEAHVWQEPEIVELYRNEDVETYREIERLARLYKVEVDVARKIIQCEANFKHVTGTRAKVGQDIGRFQINDHFHEERAAKLGLDIHDPEDNLKYGMRLLAEEGTEPWSASRKCHGL